MVYDLPKLDQDVINNLSQSITSNAFVVVIYNQVLFTKQLLSDCFKMEIKRFFKWGQEKKENHSFVSLKNTNEKIIYHDQVGFISEKQWWFNICKLQML